MRTGRQKNALILYQKAFLRMTAVKVPDIRNETRVTLCDLLYHT